MLGLYTYYQSIRQYVLTRLGSIVFIYYLTCELPKNITLNYYHGHDLEKYHEGQFYLKVIDSGGTRHVAFDGTIDEVRNFLEKKLEPMNHPKRKNIILLDHDSVVAVDLALLDNYQLNTKYFNKPITNLTHILNILNINCTHMVTIQNFPFKKTVTEINGLDISDLYN